MIGRAHPIQLGGVRGVGKEVNWRNPTGSLSHSRVLYEGVHVRVFAKLFFDTCGPIWREAIVRLLLRAPTHKPDPVRGSEAGSRRGIAAKEKKNKEKDEQPEKIKRKIDFSDLRNP